MDLNCDYQSTRRIGIRLTYLAGSHAERRIGDCMNSIVHPVILWKLIPKQVAVHVVQSRAHVHRQVALIALEIEGVARAVNHNILKPFYLHRALIFQRPLPARHVAFRGCHS